MGRYSAGARSAGGSATLPIGSLYAAAGVGGWIREIGITNTTATAVSLRLARFTTAGTPGTGLTEAPHVKGISPAAGCTAANSHTSTAPTLGDDLGYATVLGASVGAGVIWTFGDQGLLVPVGTANGVGIICVGTVQVVDFYFVWDE